MKRIKIGITNNRCIISGDPRITLAAYKAFSIRNPNAYHIRRYMPKGWDGKFHYITERGSFRTGLLDKVVSFVKSKGASVEYIDEREENHTKVSIPKKLSKGTLRDYQYEAVASIVNNTIPGTNIPLRRGVINAATNAGKTWIAAGIYYSFNRDLRALILLNDSDLYDQFHREIPELVDGDAGFVRGKERNWDRFTVGMVPTISQNIKLMKRDLAKYDIVLVDEADLADNKSYRRVLEACINATVRVGLSGTIFMSKLAKDKPKNYNLESYFGPERFKITKQELVNRGISTNLVIKISQGNTQTGTFLSYPEEYQELITRNPERNLRVLQRSIFNIKRGRLPLLVVAQFHEHIDILHSLFEEKLGDKYTIMKVTHITKGRKKIFEAFRLGRIDILISSMIVKRGKNLPLIKAIIYAGAGDSNENVSQIMGRGERKHESKSKTYIEDFYDEGKYLKRHSNHRVTYYAKEKFKIIKLYKKSAINNKTHKSWLKRKRK